MFLKSLFLIGSTMIIFSGCAEKCADCHIHDSAGNTTNEQEVCGKGKDYNDKIEALKKTGYDCHEKH